MRWPDTTWVSPARDSGWRTVDANPSSCHLATPKSASLARRVLPRIANRMLWGFTSRWTMPSEWASASASHIARVTLSVSATSCGPRSRKSCDSVPPFMNSETWNGTLPSRCPKS